MSVFSPGRFFHRFEKRFAFGYIIGIIGTIIGVWSTYFRSQDAELNFDILSNTTVIDLKENVGKIDILYDSTSILEKKQSLSLLTFRISNTGNGNITTSSYDTRFPLGFKILKGTIVEIPSLIQTSDPYLKTAIGLKRKGKDSITFDPFIFNRNNSFTIKVLVLHNQNDRPEVLPIGKIAGIQGILLTKSYLEKEQKTFIQQTLEGNIFVHVARLLFYILLFIAVGLLIVYPSFRASELLSLRDRKRKVEKFKFRLGRSFSEAESIITDLYIRGNLKILKIFLRNHVNGWVENSESYGNEDFFDLVARQQDFDSVKQAFIKTGKAKEIHSEIAFDDDLMSFVKSFVNSIEFRGMSF